MVADRQARRRSVLVLYQSSSVVCGVGSWVESLSQELTGRGYDVTVGLTWGRCYHDPRQIERARPRLKTVWMDGRTGSEEGRIQAIARTVRRLRPDVVILTCLQTAFEAVRRLRYDGVDVRLMATNHGNFPGHAASLIEQQDVVDMSVCVARLSAEAMSAEVSESLRTRIRHIPNPVPLPLAGAGQPAHVFRVGYAGRLDGEGRKRARDLEPFVHELARRAPDVELWIAGDGPQLDAVKEFCAPFGDRIRCLGGLSRTALYERFYPALDVFVTFAASEGWPLALAEAMAHGVVPVTSAFTGIWREGLIRHDVNGMIFPVGEPCTAARVIADLTRDPSRVARLKRAAAAAIRDHHTLNHFGEAFAGAIEDVLALPALARPARPVSLGCRGRMGLAAPQWETVRRLLRRRVPHGSAGEEWPQYQCADRPLIDRIERRMACLEEAARGACAP